MNLKNFADLKRLVGFDGHDAWEKRCAVNMSNVEQLSFAGSSHGLENKKRRQD